MKNYLIGCKNGVFSMVNQNSIINKMNGAAVHEALSDDLGETVLKIDLLSKLNGGMRNEVWRIRARGKTQKKDYVLKSHATLIDDRGFSKFKNEVYSLRYIRNATGLAPRLIYCSEPQTMMIMDFISGETMHDKINSTENQRILQPVIDAFAKIHSLHEPAPHPYLFHRDPADLTEAISLVEWHIASPMPFLTDVKKYADIIIDTLKTGAETFILGDGTPTNLISAHDGRLVVIDTELASLGNPSVDISQFLLYSNLEVPEKIWFVQQYCDSMKINTVRFMQLVDYNTIFIGLLTAGIYARELSAVSSKSKERDIVKQQRINSFIYACDHLLSTDVFSKK